MLEDNIKLDYINKFQECIKIAEEHELSTKELVDNINEIKEFKVVTPIIGGFSTGKSSMINALLDDKLLKTDITPETAIPTEIIYGNDTVEIYKDNEVIEKITIQEFKEKDEDIEHADLIKIYYDNKFLSYIKNVKIVDMPGFDSGIDNHNKAIDNYLPKSLAYIITFSADESVIKESIANFLGELKLHEIPIFVVLTKCDKVSKSNLDKTISYMKKNLPKYLNSNEPEIYCIKSKRDKDVSALNDVLVKIEEKAQELFKKKYNADLISSVMPIEKYINSRIHNINLTDSELDEKQGMLENKLQNSMKKLQDEKEKFNVQVMNSIKIIQEKIHGSLISSSSTLQSMILKDCDIQEKVNLIVRNSIVTGVKSEFEPKFQKYVKKIAELIDINIDVETTINLDSFKLATDDMVKNIVVKSIPVILATIGGLFAGPLGAVIGGALAVFVDSLFKNKHDKEKKELAREKVENEIIPMIVEKAGICIKNEILSYVDEINNTISEKIELEKDTIEKSLKDIKEKRKLEEDNKKEEMNGLKKELEEIRGIIDGIK